MTRTTRHPSDRRKRRWLKTGSPGRLSDHIAHCEACTAFMENEQGAVERISQALALVTAPPADLDSRMVHSVSEVVRRREALGTFADLFGLGWTTGKTIMEWPDREDDAR